MRVVWILSFIFLLTLPVSAELPSALASPYLRIHIALSDDSTEGVEAAATALEDAALALGQAATDIASAAKSVAEAKAIKEARNMFSLLSNALIDYSRAVGLGDLKIAYCPMADESWVQSDGAIANPYYGSAMLTCGSFR